MSKIKVQRPQVNIQEGAKTYDNQTEEIQSSWRTTYREQYYRVAGTCNLSGHVARRYL